MNVFDANCWCEYATEWLHETPGIGTTIIDVAKENGGLLMDDGLQAKQQYIDMKKPYAEQLFDAWSGEAMAFGWLKLIDISGKGNLYKELSNLGVPKKEHVFFRIAVHGNAKYVVSFDSDFFCPEKKFAGEKQKMDFISKGKGPVCKHFKKNYDIRICCPHTYASISAIQSELSGV